MSINRYIVSEPDQLTALYAMKPNGNRMMENYARVWRAQMKAAEKNQAAAMPAGWARIEFDTKVRKCRVYKCFSRTGEPIGMLPYNKALAYCKEHLELEKGSRGL